MHTYLLRNKIFSLLFLLVLPIMMQAQSEVKGVVLTVDSIPLAGVTVSTRDGKGIFTDNEGQFTIATVADSLHFVYLGYQDRWVKVTGAENLVILSPAVYQFAPLTIWHTYQRPLYQQSLAFSSLSKKTIEAYPQENIAPALNRIPGVFMHSGAYNTNRLTIRGIGSRNLFGTAKIRAMVDGIPLTNGSGETSIEDLDLSFIDKISVQKGPTSSIYGAGLGGAVILQTPDDLAGDSIRLSLAQTTGSYGLQRHIFNYKRAYTGNTFIFGNIHRTISGGYRDQNKYNRFGLNVLLKSALNSREKVTVLGSYINLKAEIPSSLNADDYYGNPSIAAPNWEAANGKERYKKLLVGGSYETQITDFLSQHTTLYLGNRQSYERRPFNILSENNTNYGAKTDWAYQKSLLPEQGLEGSIHVGTEIFWEDYYWQTYERDSLNGRGLILSDNQEVRTYGNLFVQGRLHWQQYAELTAGINYNRTEYKLTDRYFLDTINLSGRQVFPAIASPYLSLGLNLSRILEWNKMELSMQLVASHGFSPPTLEETLNPEGTINPSIRPEQGWNFEGGLKGRIKNWEWQVAYHSMHIQDLLVAQRTALDQFIGINAGKTIHNGLEIEVQHNYRYKKLELQSFLNYTYADYRFEEFINEEKDYSGNQLTGTAPNLLNIGTQWELSNFYGKLEFRFVDNMPLRDDNSIYSSAYQLLDIKVGHHFSLFPKLNLNAYLGVNNILDEKYASMVLINASSFGGNLPRYYYPGLPRNFYVGIQISFGR